MASTGLSTAGRQAATKVVYAVDRLKEKFPQSLTFSDLLSYAFNAAEQADEDQVRSFRQFLKVNTKVTYNEANKTYRFRPHLDISNGDELLAYFQKQESTQGIEVRKLKEGWPDCDTAINDLERQHKLLVLRNKKDQHPRMVWADDASLNAPLDEEFVQLWSSISIPNQKDDVVKQLQAMGHTTTGEIVKNVAAVAPVKKVKKTRRGAKITNQHMQGMLRDYSDKRAMAK